jgi:hypothetical protein
MHLHLQGWQPSLYKTHSDFEAYFEGKKMCLIHRKIRYIMRSFIICTHHLNDRHERWQLRFDASAHLLLCALLSQSASESWCMKYSVTSSVKQMPFVSVCIYTYTHTHTHTHIDIYIPLYVTCLHMCWSL